MFGKQTTHFITINHFSGTQFQSPCAGNMFGKVTVKHDESGHEQKMSKFQSPCAGNMFGKSGLFFVLSLAYMVWVSIPVCGEHVW